MREKEGMATIQIVIIILVVGAIFMHKIYEIGISNLGWLLVAMPFLFGVFLAKSFLMEKLERLNIGRPSRSSLADLILIAVVMAPVYIIWIYVK